MSEKYIVYGLRDGCGGLILAFQCAHFIKQAGHEVVVRICAKDEIYKPLHHLFSDQFAMKQLPEHYAEIAGSQTSYWVWPDALFRNPNAFDYKRFNTSLNAIKSQRLLQHKLKVTNKIGLFLNSNTNGYSYSSIGKLATEIAKRFPDKTVYLPILNEWQGVKIPDVILNDEDCPPNLMVEENQDFNKVIDHLLECELTICSDSGPSHISFNTGQTRILLDPYAEITRNTIGWWTRWRQTDGTCGVEQR